MDELMDEFKASLGTSQPRSHERSHGARGSWSCRFFLGWISLYQAGSLRIGKCEITDHGPGAAEGKWQMAEVIPINNPQSFKKTCVSFCFFVFSFVLFCSGWPQNTGTRKANRRNAGRGPMGRLRPRGPQCPATRDRHNRYVMPDGAGHQHARLVSRVLSRTSAWGTPPGAPAACMVVAVTWPV
jgi:hypothetical protein